jgi:ribosomal protein S18 acetylase RimI-like enzyme
MVLPRRSRDARQAIELNGQPRRRLQKDFRPLPMSSAQRPTPECPSEEAVSLRPFRTDDLDVLHRIDQACFAPGVSYSRQELAAFIARPSSETWLAIARDRVIGFLVAERAPQRAGHIITIDVAEHWRRRHVGTLLMDAAEEWARRQKLRFIYLEAAEDNLPAQAFYEKRGYVRIRQVARYYANGAAAWVMVKALSKSMVDNRQP